MGTLTVYFIDILVKLRLMKSRNVVILSLGVRSEAPE